MECPNDETIGEYVAGRAAGSTREQLESHLDGCSSCQELVVALGRGAMARGTPGDAPTVPAHGGATRTPATPRSALGRYQIDGVIGAGGMGVVYRAHDPQLGRAVALKVVQPGDGATQARARLVREARAMAKIAHPNVITVHDAGTVDDEVFIAMELVAGSNLADWERAMKRSWLEVLGVYLQAARGLAAAHRAGLVHRDFKPHNALVADDGRVRVLDFGLARTVHETQATVPVDGSLVRPSQPQITRTGAVLGSPQFMSPEQHHGEPTDARSDQFSFCVALYHALYGRYPFPGETYGALADAVTSTDALPPPRRTNVPSSIGRAVLRGLRREPLDRFASMDDLSAALSAAMRRRRTGWLAAGALAAIATVTVLLLATRSSPTASGSPPIALAYGQHQQQVTFDGARAPDVSPDGRYLAYKLNEGVAIREVATGAVHVIHETTIVFSTRWSPRSDVLALATSNGLKLFTARGEDVRVWPLVGRDCNAAWSGDARQLLYHCPAKLATWTVFTVDTGSVETRTIELPEQTEAMSFDWSPTGRIAIASRSTTTDGLWVVEPGSTTPRHIADEHQVEHVRWNARGDRLYYNRRPASDAGTEIVYRRLETATEPVEQVLSLPTVRLARATTFSLSPDEQSIFYVSFRAQSDLVLVPHVGSSTALTNDHQDKAALALAPDGSSIAYAAGTPQGKFLYRKRIPSGQPERLDVPMAEYYAASFSPTGDALVVTTYHAGVTATSIIDLASQTQRPLQHPATDPRYVYWTPAGIMAFTLTNQLVVIDPATGKAVTRDVPADCFLPASVPARDGRAMAAACGWGRIAWLDLASGNVRNLTMTSPATAFAVSADSAWIYAVEPLERVSRTRVVAVSTTGDGSRRSVVTGENVVSGEDGLEPLLPVITTDESIIHVTAETSTDVWLASRDARPPVVPAQPSPAEDVPPIDVHSSPVSLTSSDTTLTGWDVTGDPVPSVVAAPCAPHAHCIELDGPGRSKLVQHFDATAYRGHRIQIDLDARIDNTKMVVSIESAIFDHRGVVSGQERIPAGPWGRRTVFADIAPDAKYIDLKISAPGDGKAWVTNLTVTRAR